MNKNRHSSKLLLILPLSALGLVACGGKGASSSQPSTGSGSQDSSELPGSGSSSTAPVVQYPSIQDVMRGLSEKRNYTFTMEDGIFDMTTDMYFTEKAYYVDYKDATLESAVPFGYAEDADGSVFEFALNGDQVTPGEYLRSNSGEVIKDLWANAIISFADFNIDALPSTPTEDNVYPITDDANKTLFALLSGYGDAFVLPYVTVTAEVISEDAFKVIIHFAPDNEQYTGDCVCTVRDIGTTKIPGIDEYLAEGGKGTQDTDQTLLDVLQKLKSDGNYTIESTSPSTHYVDTVTADYYYSDNKNTPASSKGYINLGEHAYNFTMPDGKVQIGSEITYTSSTSKSFWDNVSSIHNLSTLNLSDFAVEETSDGLKLTNNVSVLNSFYNLVHSTSFFPSVNVSTDYLLFTSVSDTALSFTLHIEAEADFTVTISNIGTTKDEAIESFIEENKNFDKNDISGLTNAVNSLASGNYTIALDNKFSAFANDLASVGSLNIAVSSDDYFITNLTDEKDSYGYKMIDGTLSKYAYEEGQQIVVDTFEGTMEDNDVFLTLKDIDFAGLDITHNIGGTYTLKGADGLTAIANLLTLPTGAFTTYLSSLTLSVDGGAIAISGTTSWYGSFSATIQAA